MSELLLEVRNLNFRYPDGTCALTDISFELRRGTNMAVIGPNGAGKSTLLLHMNGVLRGEGDILFFGQKLDRKNLRFIRSRIGIVFQDPNDQLFMPTVYDDVAFGLRSRGMGTADVKQRVEAALDLFGLDSLRSKNPDQLSLGQKKKAALAGILVLEPEVIVLDEPCASLDPGSKKRFITLLQSLPQTKVIATHDMDLVRQLCPQVLLMDRGRIAAAGPAERILADREMMEHFDLEAPLSL